MNNVKPLNRASDLFVGSEIRLHLQSFKHLPDRTDTSVIPWIAYRKFEDTLIQIKGKHLKFARHSRRNSFQELQSTQRLQRQCPDSGSVTEKLAVAIHTMKATAGFMVPSYLAKLMRNSAFDFVFLRRWISISIDSTGPIPCIVRRKP